MTAIRTSPKFFTHGFGLRTKLLLTLGSLCAFVAIMAGITLWGLRVLDQTDQVLDEAFTLNNYARETSLQALMLRRYEKDVFLNINDPKARDEYQAKWDAAYTALTQAIDGFGKAGTTDDDRQQEAQWRTAAETYRTGFLDVVQQIKAGRITTPQAANEAIAPTKESSRTLADDGSEFAAVETREATDAQTTLNQDINRVRTLTLGTAALALLLGGLGSVWFARHMLQPITALQAATHRLTGGDLHARVNLKRRDEFGALGQNFDTMAQALQERVNAEQAAQAEAQQLRQQEKASRQQLEQAVGEYLQFANGVAQGNLQQRVDVHYEGVIGQLGHGLNSMVVSLQQITNQVQQASASIASAASEILASTAQQAASATEQSAAITQTTTTVEEVKAIAQQTAQQAQRLVLDSQGMLQATQRGTQAVDQTVDGMGLIRERVDSIAHTILALAEQTQAISEITTTVTDLADQSNLLALNAAIEAARAGEQGKGFAVVAQHVRDLAERSKGATTQVREILNEIQRATSTAVMVTEEGTKGATQGAGLANQAGQVITEIAQAVETGAQANMQVAAAAQQQTAGMEQIGQAMGAIQQATTETLSSTRQAERAAKDLATLAQSLQQAVAAYQV